MSEPGNTAVLTGDVSAESFVRETLRRLEYDFREMALLALADWEALGIVAPELFRSVANLQRPSWGHWNGLLGALREVRKRVLREGTAEQRERVREAVVLHAILDCLDGEAAAELVTELRPLAKQMRTTLGRKPTVGALLVLPITLRNDIAHFQPADASWWQRAAEALAPLARWCAAHPLRPSAAGVEAFRAPWFLDGPAGGALNGVREEAVLYAVPSREAVASAAMVPLLHAALQRLFGRERFQGESLKKLLARLAPDELKGVLLGDFLIRGPVVGRGGFACVYAGTQVSTGRKVAVKVLHDGLGEEDRARFLQEGVLLSQFNHPHIVGVIGQGEEPWFGPREPTLAEALAREDWFQELAKSAPVKTFLALEWVEGHSLEQIYRGERGSRPTVGELTDWFAQAAQAVAAVHAAGLLHRDITPSNLMVTPAGQVKLMDFGIARKQDPLRTIRTTPGRALGTRAYMAPEQLETRGPEEPGAGADLYGLCATFYELYTASRLFSHDRETEQSVTTRKHTEPRPPRPRSLRRDLPWEVDVVVAGGLEREPADRYQTAAELERDLRHVLRYEPIEYRRPTLPRRLRLWWRRNPVVGTLTALVITLVVAGAAGGTGALIQIDTARNDAQNKAAENLRLANSNRDLADEERIQKEQAQSNDYVKSITLSTQAWLSGNAGRSEQILDACPTDRRDWEWRYRKQLCHAELLTLHPAESIYQLAFCRIGERLIASGDDNTVWLGSARTGQEVGRLKGHTGRVYRIALSADWARLASAADDCEIRIWDMTGDRLLRAFRGPQSLSLLALSPDGRLLATASHVDASSQVLLYDLTTGLPLARLDSPMSDSPYLAFSPDGKTLAIPGPEPRLFDVATRKLVRTLSSPADHLAFSPDGKYLASARGRTLTLWDARSGAAILNLLGHELAISALTFSPDGQFLAAASGSRMLGEITIRAVPTGEEVHRFRGHTAQINCLVYSPDGRRLVAADQGKRVKVWDATAAQEYRMFAAHTGPVYSLAFTADGQYLVSGGDFIVKVFHPTTGHQLHALEGHTKEVWGVACSPDGKLAASASFDTSVKVWDLSTGQELRTFTGHQSAVYGVAFSPDGSLLASGSKGEIRIWNAATGQPLHTLGGHTGTVYSLAFSRDGQLLASASDDQTVIVWHAGTLEKLHTFKGGFNSLAFSPNGQLLAAAGTETLIRGPVTIQFKNDEKMIMELNVGTSGDAAQRERRVKLWDLETGNVAFELHGHTRPVQALAFSADGKRLVTGSVDQSVIIWDTATGKDLLTLAGHGAEVFSVALSSPGNRLATGDGNGQVRLWDADDPWEAAQAARREMMDRTGQDWQQRQARAAEAAGKWFAADFHLSRLIESQPTEDLLFTRRGRARAELGQRAQALTDSDQALKRNGKRPWNWFQRALICLKLDDVEGYRMVCAEMLARFGDTQDGGTAWRVVETCGLRADGVAAPQRLVELGQRAVRLLPHACSAHHRLGLALYRAGQFEDAIRALELALDKCGRKGTAWDWFLLAMAHERLGHPDEALMWFNDAGRWTDLAFSQLPPEAVNGTSLADYDRMQILSLRQEAEALFGKPPLAVPDAVTGLRRYLLRMRRLREYAAKPACKQLALDQEFESGHDFSRAAQRIPGLRVPLDRTWAQRLAPLDGPEREAWLRLAQDFTQEVEQDPTRWWAWRGRALACASLQQWQQADEAYSKALEGKPKDFGSRYGRGRARLELGRADEALSDLSRAIELGDGDAGLCYLRGMAYYVLKQYDKAAADFTQALERGAVICWPVWTMRGEAHGKLSRPDQALADYSKALELHPEEWMLWLKRGLTYSEMKRPAQAIADYTKALEHKPDAWIAWHNRAKAFFDGREWDKAHADFSRVVELQPGRWESWHHRALVQVKRARWEDAIADYSQALRLQPAEWVLWHERGLAYGRQRHWDKALADFARALEIKPEQPETWAKRADAHAELSQWDQAAAAFTRASELEPDNGAHWQSRAFLHLHAGNLTDYEALCAAVLKRFGRTGKADAADTAAWTCVFGSRATTDWAQVVRLAERAVAAQPRTHEYLQTLGAAHYRAGKTDHAVRRLEERMNMEGKGGDAWDWLFLAMAHQRLGHADDASKWLAKAQTWIDEAAREAAIVKPSHSPLTWSEKLQLGLLRREAENLLGESAHRK